MTKYGLTVELSCGSDEIGTPVERRVLQGYRSLFKADLLALHHRLIANDPAAANRVCAHIQEQERVIVGPPPKVRPRIDILALPPEGFDFKVDNYGIVLPSDSAAVGRWHGPIPVCPSTYHAVTMSEMICRRRPPPRFEWNPPVRQRQLELEKDFESMARLPNAEALSQYRTLRDAIYEARRLPIIDLVLTTSAQADNIVAGYVDWLEFLNTYRQEMLQRMQDLRRDPNP